MKSFPGKQKNKSQIKKRFMVTTRFHGWPTLDSLSLLISHKLCIGIANTEQPMATSSSYVLFLKSPRSPPSLTTPLSHNQSWFQSRMIRRTKPISTVLSVIKAQTNVRKEDTVIVGAGIAGLATALSLHRLAFFELHVFLCLLSLVHKLY